MSAFRELPDACSDSPGSQISDSLHCAQIGLQVQVKPSMHGQQGMQAGAPGVHIDVASRSQDADELRGLAELQGQGADEGA